MSAYVYEIEVAPGNGSCHYCQKGKLRDDRMGMVYPYNKVIVVEGNHIISNFCPDCFDELKSFIAKEEDK